MQQPSRCCAAASVESKSELDLWNVVPRPKHTVLHQEAGEFGIACACHLSAAAATTMVRSPLLKDEVHIDPCAVCCAVPAQNDEHPPQPGGARNPKPFSLLSVNTMQYDFWHSVALLCCSLIVTTWFKQVNKGETDEPLYAVLCDMVGRTMNIVNQVI